MAVYAHKEIKPGMGIGSVLKVRFAISDISLLHESELSVWNSVSARSPSCSPRCPLQQKRIHQKQAQQTCCQHKAGMQAMLIGIGSMDKSSGSAPMQLSR